MTAPSPRPLVERLAIRLNERTTLAKSLVIPQAGEGDKVSLCDVNINRTWQADQMANQPSKALETFPNPQPGRDYHIHMEIPEFTCLCPKTGQPDFATLELDYVADELCIELKSLKLYIWSFRNEGHFHEDVTNRILDDLVDAIQPRFIRLTAKFYVRGGIFTNVIAENRKPGWQPAPFVELGQFDAQSNIRG